MSEYLAAYCPPAAVLMLLVFLFTLLNPHKGRGCTRHSGPRAGSR